MRLSLFAALIASGVLFLITQTARANEPVRLRDVPNTSGKWQEARGMVEAPLGVVRD